MCKKTIDREKMKDRTSIPSSYLDATNLAEKMDNLHRYMFVLAGPSGVGKTTLATLLAENSKEIYVIPNHTTRGPRHVDPPNHFVYIDKTKFIYLLNQKAFFLVRLKSKLYYGYLRSDFNNAIKNKLRSLFMFRHSGINYLSSSIRNVPTVFLEGNPMNILDHSHDSTSKHSLDSIATEINKNRILASKLYHRDNSIITLYNNYDGINELHFLKNRILEFLRKANET